MTATATQSPFPQYFGTDGKPLSNGYLYFGVANQNPETNPVPVYWDAAATQPAAQPIRTKNGYPVRDGTIANVFVDGTYSLTVKNSKGVTVYYVRDSAEYDSGSFIQDGAGAVRRTVQDKLREFKSVADYGAVGDGVTDDTASIQAALNAGLCIDFGDQTKNYKVSGTLTVRSYATLRGCGARIFQTVRQAPIFNCVSKTDVTFVGLTMTGATMSVVGAGAFEVGKVYSIVTAGTTNYTLIGAANNTPGTFFTATGVGSGTGTASTFYNTPNSQDIGIKADRAINLTVFACKFFNFAYSPLMVALWGTNIKFLNNVVEGPGATVLNPLNLPDPQVPGFRNCTGVTILGLGIEVCGNTISNTSQGIYIGQQSRDVTVSRNNVLNTIVEHGMYCDAGCVNVRVTDNSFNNTKLIGAKAQWYDVTLAATALLASGYYVIDSIGTTDFTLIGAASNTVGLEFKATGPGTGTGVCSLPIPRNIVFAHNSVENAGGDGLLAINSGPAVVATITGISKPTPGTAVGATTNAAGYAVGATVITLASAGVGTILANDLIQFGNDQNLYQVTVGDADVSGGGTITIAAPGLLNAIPASATAISIRYQAGVVTTAAPHGLSVDSLIDIGGVVGMTPMNSSWRVASVPSATTFTVRTPAGPVSTASFPAYVSGGEVKKPTYGRGIVFSNNTVKNVVQDSISARYCDGVTIEGNHIDNGSRVGIYQLITLNANTSGNIVRNIQQNGIYCYSPIDQCSIYDNNLLNVGAAGIDAGGASSGIFVEGDGGGIVEGNIVQGELTRTKMLYGIQLGSGDKTQWSIDDNQIYDAESAIVAIHNLDSKSLRSRDGNIGTAASGPDADTGSATALPNRGNPRPDWWSDAAPTSGFWAQGSKVWKLLPNATDAVGWVCVASGSPGTWRPFGKVHSCAATQALSGSYTPTITAISNIDAVTPRLCQWSIDGQWCTVIGRFTLDQTAINVNTYFTMPLPVPSALGATAYATLFGNYSSIAEQQSGGIYNDGTNNLAHFKGNAATTTAIEVMFRFTYLIA